MEEWVKDLAPEELPEPYRKLSGMIGMEPTLTLAELYQGTAVYFTKLDGVLQMVRNRRIKQEFDGGNHKDLARRYNLTETWIRQILADSGHDDRQTSLFEQQECAI